MTTPRLNIVFAGTPAFTLPCLDALAHSEHHLKAIYTQPDRPAGRGRKLQASAVKEWALQHAIPIYQPLHFKEEQTVAELAALKPDVLVVIAYGLILPQRVLDIPRLGCINVHASLLPRWRGAAPIQYALLQGDSQTGVTIMQMDAGMDTGAMLSRATCSIHPQDTSQTLHDKLAQLATTPLLETLNALALGKVDPSPQDHHLATYAAKISKQDAAIRWEQPAQMIDQKIRAFNPWPIAYTQINETLTLRIHQARVGAVQNTSQPPGTILTLDQHGMLINTGHGTLCVEKFQFPGANIISVADWLHTGRQQLQVNLVLK